MCGWVWCLGSLQIFFLNPLCPYHRDAIVPLMPASTPYTPNRASDVNPDRRKATSNEGAIGGPCHTVKTDGYFCSKPATIVATDGWGYCPRHAHRTDRRS